MKSAVVVLTIQGIWGVTVTVDRLLMLVMSKRRSRKFAVDVEQPMRLGDAKGVMEVAEAAMKRSHLARFIYEGIKVFQENLALGNSRDRAAEFTQRNLERTGENLSSNLNKGMSVLATTGSTAVRAPTGSTVAQTVSTLEAFGAMDYTVVVVAPASDPAPFKYLAPYTGSAIGQHWMYQGKHVLIVFDDHRQRRHLLVLLRFDPGAGQRLGHLRAVSASERSYPRLCRQRNGSAPWSVAWRGGAPRGDPLHYAVSQRETYLRQPPTAARPTNRVPCPNHEPAQQG